MDNLVDKDILIGLVGCLYSVPRQHALVTHQAGELATALRAHASFTFVTVVFATERLCLIEANHLRTVHRIKPCGP